MNSESSPFDKADHTIIVSDIHLADAEPPHPRRPLWKRFKRKKYFIDRSFKNFLDQISHELKGTVELVFNGDTFDFDSVMAIPKNPNFPVSKLEKMRGLFAEEAKSRYKIGLIFDDHAIWVKSLREFLLKGHRIVFVIGNHDMELHWTTVQMDIVDRFDLPEELRQNVRFCEWFYISNEDTLIEHGNQYDAYCLCANPIHPLIQKSGKAFVRIPFGNLAGRYLTNGMGLMNPHYEGSYIKETFREYLVFFWKYLVRVQPGILLAWLWGAIVTLVYSLQEGLLPAMKDPLMTDARIASIAKNSNSSSRVVLSLRELHVHPAIFNPLKIIQELWLDRAIFFVGVFFVSFMIFSTVNVFSNVSQLWFWLFVLVLFPLFMFYARSIESDVIKLQKVGMRRIPLASQIARVNRVIHGHTHRELHKTIAGVDHLNTGSWSNAFKDVECREPVGRKCFAWIKPKTEGSGRDCELYEWLDPGWRLLPAMESRIGI